jgi:hypothetical protein
MITTTLTTDITKSLFQTKTLTLQQLLVAGVFLQSNLLLLLIFFFFFLPPEILNVVAGWFFNSSCSLLPEIQVRATYQ